MSVFSTNQARQFYVLKSKKSSAAAVESEGDFFVDTITKEGKTAFSILYMGKGGLISTDLIENIDTISAVKDEPIKFKQATLTAETFNVGPKDVIIVKLIYDVAENVENTQVVYGEAIFDTDIETTLQAALAVLKTNVDKVKLPFDVDATNLTITQKEGENYRRGINNADPVEFKVEISPVIDSDTTVEKIPATVAYGVSQTTANNGKKIADLEYFYMGERGDMYRGKGFPVIPETAYMVDYTAQYATLDVHYAYQGTCEDIQKSEKDILFVAKTADKAALTALRTELVGS